MQILAALVVVAAAAQTAATPGVMVTAQAAPMLHPDHRPDFVTTGIDIAKGDFFTARVNFQPDGAAPTGWLLDSGAAYGDRGNGFTYGWNIDNQANARDRNSSLSPDELHDTLNHLQKEGQEYLWEIAVPNGEYKVRVVAGDAAQQNSVYNVFVERVLVVSGTPGDASPWVFGHATVEVSDGKLTVASGPGALNNKINFIEVTTIGTSWMPVELPFKVYLPEVIR